MSLFTELESAAAGEHRPLAAVLDALVFDDAGLIPAIAQDAASGEVLMLAWMSRASLDITLEEGFVCYYSRSRGRLWRKGETSGHRQRLKELRFDCDGDAVLVRVDQTGPACHTNRASCFYLRRENGLVSVICDPV